MNIQNRSGKSLSISKKNIVENLPGFKVEAR